VLDVPMQVKGTVDQGGNKKGFYLLLNS